MPWVLLFAAGLLEIVWAYAMKEAQGFTRLPFVLLMIVAMMGSFGLLALAMRSLPLGTSYMIWTGIGAVGAFVVGILMLGEAVTAQRIVAAFLLIAGMITMRLS